MILRQEGRFNTLEDETQIVLSDFMYSDLCCFIHFHSIFVYRGEDFKKVGA